MVNEAEHNGLAENRYSGLVVRFLINKEGNLLHGRLVDLSGNTVSQFRQLDEISDLIDAWLSAQTTSDMSQFD